MRKPTITQIENAFLPAKEITDAERFAGRESAISDVYYALIAEGSNIAVIGNRGIGKTSLARQIMSIGSGDNAILDKVGIKYDGPLDFLTIYFACGNQVISINDLLERLLTASNCLSEWIYDIPNAKKIMTDYSPKISAKLFETGFEMGASRKTENTNNSALPNHKIDIVFTNIVDAIIKRRIARDGILIIIDEFDQISDPSGFASFLKAIATNNPKVKFCIVGVAKDIQVLMKEHGSTDRLFTGSIIGLESMGAPELESIISNAEQYINGFISFQDDARRKMIDLAQGHPYMIHLIGKLALRSAFQDGRSSISSNDINNTLSSIAEHRTDPVLEGKYRKAVASSQQREVVLKAMASAKDEQGEIWTTNAYKIALDRGVENASHYVGQLVIEEYGAELDKIRERYYRFKDSLFHAYVMARPSMYDDTV